MMEGYSLDKKEQLYCKGKMTKQYRKINEKEFRSKS